MVAFSLVTIHCDGCNDWCDAGVADTAREARDSLKRLGWDVAVNEPRATRKRPDYCPKCVRRRWNEIARPGHQIPDAPAPDRSSGGVARAGGAGL